MVQEGSKISHTHFGVRVTCHRFPKSRLVGSRASDKSNARKAVTSHAHSKVYACNLLQIILSVPFSYWIWNSTYCTLRKSPQ